MIALNCPPDAIAAALGLRRGGNGRWLCPSCQTGEGHRHADLSINSTGGWRCFKCGLHGNLYELVKVTLGVDFAAAREWMQAQSFTAADTGFDRPRLRPADRPENPVSSDRGAPEVFALFLSRLQPAEASEAFPYLSGRMLTYDTIRAAGLRYCTAADYDAGIDAVRRAFGPDAAKAAKLTTLYTFRKPGLPFIVIPYLADGQEATIRARCFLSKAEAERRDVPRYLSTGPIPCLYNGDTLASVAEAVITEGELDCLTVQQFGRAAVGVPGAKNFKREWAKLFSGKTAVIGFDGDDAGRAGADTVAGLLHAEGVRVKRMELAEGADMNDHFRELYRARARQVAEVVATWPEANREAFDERAGILEFDGGLPPELAAVRAFEMMQVAEVK